MKQPLDINQKGNAYSIVSWEYPTPIIKRNISRLESILRNGLLGTASIQRNGGFGVNTTKFDYGNLLAEGHKRSVFFHILGRLSGDHDQSYKSIDQNGYLLGDPKNQIGILFDLSLFQEGQSYGLGALPKKDDGENGVYRAYNNQKGLAPGEALAYSDYGFVISPMISPEHFLGIIFKRNKELTPQEHEKRIEHEVAKNIQMHREGKSISYYEMDRDHYREDWRYRFIEENNPEKLEQRANEIASEILNVNTGQPDLIIPVFDIHGNMWWPEKVPYTELKVNE